jgi:hypothetical protein
MIRCGRQVIELLPAGCYINPERFQQKKMRFPWANSILLTLLTLQIITGLGALMAGSEPMQWVLWLHGAGAYGVVIILLWKSAVIVRAIRRRPRWSISRVGFLWLTVLLIGTLVTGFYWSYDGPQFLAAYSLVTVHGWLAVAMWALLLWHTFAKRFVFRIPIARNRRAFLRLGGVALAGALLWRGERSVQSALSLPGAQRRFTGSYETGSFTGRFPYVVWLFDNPAPVDPTRWILRIDGAVQQPLELSLAELTQLADATQTALLDCTGGWYTIQEWTGVPLALLLEQAGLRNDARSVTVESVTGYMRRFPLEEASRYLLATHVAGRPLDHGHGFPLRLVAPNRRGFEWVKWVTRVHVNTTSALLQPPLPLQ